MWAGQDDTQRFKTRFVTQIISFAIAAIFKDFAIFEWNSRSCPFGLPFSARISQFFSSFCSDKCIILDLVPNDRASGFNDLFYIVRSKCSFGVVIKLLDIPIADWSVSVRVRACPSLLLYSCALLYRQGSLVPSRNYFFKVLSRSENSLINCRECLSKFVDMSIRVRGFVNDIRGDF